MPYVNLTIVVVLTLISGIACAANPKVRRYECWFLVMSIILMVGLYAFSLLANVGRVFTYRLDEYSYLFDSNFGEPSFVIGRFMARYIWVDLATRFAYNTMFSLVAIVVSFYFCTQPLEHAVRVVMAMLTNMLGFLVYFIVPVSGPRYLMPSFPFGNHSIVHPHVVYIAAIPNGFPSLHFSTALLLAWAVWKWRWGKMFGFLYVVAVALCTLGSGEHYLLDLLGSVILLWLCVYCSADNRRGEEQGRICEICSTEQPVGSEAGGSVGK